MKHSVILIGYLKGRRGLLVLFVIQFAVLTLVLSLYGISLIPLLYGTLILVVVILLFGLVDYRQYVKSIRTLEGMKKQVSLYLADLPQGSNPLKSLYAEILSILEQRCQRLSLEAKEREDTTAQYYTIWSHQAKTPLAAMRLLLQEEKPDFSALQQELLKAEQYVDMALQYQRLNRVSTDLVLRSYSVEDLVRQAVKEVASLFIYKKVKLELGNLEGTILTDNKWLLFVLEQILSNAVKYTSTGTVTIYCNKATLYIVDTGIGISPEDLPRILEWGYTGYNGHGEHRATGIGLSLCKRALTMLGHSIRITSQVGVGTTVAIDLSRKELEIE